MRNSKLKFAILSLLAVVLLNIIFSFGNTLVNGAHPEYSWNREAGPCDLVGSSLNSVGWNIIPMLTLWLLILWVGFTVRWQKHGSKNKKLDGLLLTIIAIPVIMMINLLLMLVRF